MNNWHSFINGKGYIGMKVSNDDAVKINYILYKLGVKNYIDKNDLHITLIYDKRNPELNYRPDVKSFIGYHIDIQMMGKPDSEYYAIALILVSDQLQQKHKELKDFGFQHSYPDFVPHVSLIYKPMDRDIEIIMNNKEKIIHDIKAIHFDSEWIQELKS